MFGRNLYVNNNNNNRQWHPYGSNSMMLRYGSNGNNNGNGTDRPRYNGRNMRDIRNVGGIYGGMDALNGRNIGITTNNNNYNPEFS